MKLTITFIFLFFFTCTYSQDIIYFKDGTTEKGLVKSFIKGKVGFKLEKNGKIKRFGKKNVDKVIVTNEEDEIIFTYRNIEGIPSSVLSGELIKGKASLYVSYIYVPGTINNENIPWGSKLKTIGGPFSIYYMYIDGKAKALKIMPNSLTTPFNKSVSAYTTSCSSLSKDIKIKKLKYEDLAIITKKYNDSCSQ